MARWEGRLPRSPRIWVVDTSILVPYFRSRRYRRFIVDGLARSAVFLPGVVLCELYAGARSHRDRADLERLRRALGAHLLGTSPLHWALSGRCLAAYSARWGRIRPRDHLADVLVAVSAADAEATIASENIEDMERWVQVLGRLGYRVELERPDPE